jgi:hypothetical protein
MPGHANSTDVMPIRGELRVSALFEDDVRPLPRLVIDETPLVAGAGVVDCDEHVARADGECLASDGGEFEHAGQRDDILRDRIVVPA